MDRTVHTLFFSPTHGTRRVTLSVAGILAHELKGKRLDSDMTLPHARETAHSFGAGDVLVLGFPVYAGRVPEVFESTLQRLSGKKTPVIIVATYGNRAYDDALLEAKDILTEKGFTVIAAAAFIAEHSFSSLVGAHRPDSKDLNIGNAFARRVAAQILSGTVRDVKVKGKSPYKERSAALVAAPVTSDECTECMRCAHECPTGAIDADDPFEVNSALCIHCCACVKFCPVGAKTFESPKIAQLTAMLEKNCTARKEPEFFEN